jgi:hypothetical protein
MEDHKFHSSDIILMLEQLLKDFKDKRNSINEDEVKSVKAFDILMKEKHLLMKETVKTFDLLMEEKHLLMEEKHKFIKQTTKLWAVTRAARQAEMDALRRRSEEDLAELKTLHASETQRLTANFEAKLEEAREQSQLDIQYDPRTGTYGIDFYAESTRPALCAQCGEAKRDKVIFKQRLVKMEAAETANGGDRGGDHGGDHDGDHGATRVTTTTATARQRISLNELIPDARVHVQPGRLGRNGPRTDPRRTTAAALRTAAAHSGDHDGDLGGDHDGDRGGDRSPRTKPWRTTAAALRTAAAHSGDHGGDLDGDHHDGDRGGDRSPRTKPWRTTAAALRKAAALRTVAAHGGDHGGGLGGDHDGDRGGDHSPRTKPWRTTAAALRTAATRHSGNEAHGTHGGGPTHGGGHTHGGGRTRVLRPIGRKYHHDHDGDLGGDHDGERNGDHGPRTEPWSWTARSSSRSDGRGPSAPLAYAVRPRSRATSLCTTKRHPWL